MDKSLRDELTEEVDEIWSEQLTHLPMASGLSDPERQKSDFLAVLRTGDRDLEKMNPGRGGTARSGFMSAGGFMRIDRVAYQDLQIRKNDKILAIGRAGEPMFEVLSVDDRSHLRLICELGDA
jgi:hypothetical protein